MFYSIESLVSHVFYNQRLVFILTTHIVGVPKGAVIKKKKKSATHIQERIIGRKSNINPIHDLGT